MHISLNKSLLNWRLEHIIELHPRSHYLLFLRIISSMLRSFFPRHIEENDQTHEGNKEHSPGYGGNDEAGQFIV